MIKKIPKYKVLDKNNNVIVQGNILYEIIETLVLNTIKHIESKKSLITRIEKNYFVYFDLLSTIYQNSDHFVWENIKSIEMVLNNSHFVKKEEFIYIKRNKFELADFKEEFNVIYWQYRQKN
jgi:hypothetical protein